MKKNLHVLPACLALSGIIVFLFDYITVIYITPDGLGASQKLSDAMAVVRIVIEFLLLAVCALIVRRKCVRDTALSAARLSALYAIAVYLMRHFVQYLGVNTVIGYIVSIPMTVMDVFPILIAHFFDIRARLALLLIFQCITPFLIAFAAKSGRKKDEVEEEN